MAESLRPEDWETLINRIKNGKCTPFIGAGACYGILPLAKDIAFEWAKKHKYPMEDIDDLGRVAQYLAITHDPVYPKEKVSKFLQDFYPEDLQAIEETHGLIAGMPMPVYITTNYDNFMYRALQAKEKSPKRVLCQWNKYVQKLGIFKLDEDFKATAKTPILFHLHGLNEVSESLVLTEDDYVDFLVNISRDKDLLIPYQIQEAITGSSLLFIGYSLRDWNFRVVFRGLISQMEASLRRISVAVQLKVDDKNKMDYLDKYFGNMNIKVFWGDAKDFIKELKTNWEIHR